MNKKISALLFFVANIALAQVSDPIQEAGDLYLKSFSKKITEDNSQLISPEKEKYISWLNDFWNNKYNDSVVQLTFQTREVLVKTLTEEMKPVSKRVKTSANILEDTRVLGSDSLKASSMPGHLFPGYTLAGDILKALILAQPTSDRKELNRRQSLIREMIQTESLHKTLPPILKEMSQYEPTVVSLLDKNDQIYDKEIQKLVDRYGDPSSMKKLYNKAFNLASRGGSTFLFIVSGTLILATLTSPFLNERYCSCRFFSEVFCSVISLGLQAGGHMIDHYLKLITEGNKRNLYRTIRIRIDLLSHYLRQAQSLQLIPDLPEDLKLAFDAQETALLEAFLYGSQWFIDSDPNAQNPNIEYASEMLWYSFKLKQTIARVLYQSARIDMYLAIARRMALNAPGDNQITFAEFKGSSPNIIARGLWSPLLNPCDAVTNDINFEASDVCLPRFNPDAFTTNTCAADSEPAYKNLLLSGCNASGKSTLMRAITVNAIYLAQIFGVATADYFQTGLFHVIHSQMDKHDQTGKFSSYEGELEHAMEIFTQAKALGINENMLVCFDELFSNTDPDESLYVTNKILNAMARQPRTINIVSSHYEVEPIDNDPASSDEYARMHMHIEKLNNTLINTYKLRHGENKEINGLHLLLKKFRLFPDIYSELEHLIEDNNGE